MNKLLLIISLLFIPSIADAQLLSLDDISRATCKITVVKNNLIGRTYSYGTGIVVSEDEDEYYIVTNGHVAGSGSSSVLVEFFYNGHKSGAAQARTQWVRFQSGTTIDMAFLAVKKSVFGKIPPIIVPIADKNVQLKPGDYVYGAGCPNGYWNQSWEGRVTNVSENITYVNMPPVEGQSGSALLANVTNADGSVNTKVVGLVTWRIGNSPNIYGGAISLKRMNQLMAGTATPDRISTSFSYLLPTGYNQNKQCEVCSLPFSEHMVIPDRNGGLVRDKNGNIQIMCPNSKSTIGIGIKTKVLAGECSTCPPGGCPLLPWNNSPNVPHPSPVQPAPISPNGIWNIPDGDLKDPNIGWQSSDEKKKLDEKLELLTLENEELKKTIDSISNQLNLTEGEKSQLMIDYKNSKNLIEDLQTNLESLTGEKSSLLQEISLLSSSIQSTETQIKSKTEKYESLLNDFLHVTNKKEELEQENEKLAEDDMIKNVSFTAAGIAGTAGMWLLKSYVIPSIVGGFSRRRKNSEKQNPNNDQREYNNVESGSVPESISSNLNMSGDTGISDKTMMPKHELPPGQYANEISQLQNWNTYAAYQQQVSPMIRGLSPGAPYGTPFARGNPTSDQIMTALSEISNEYAADYTMTPGHVTTLLRQRLKSKYGYE